MNFYHANKFSLYLSLTVPYLDKFNASLGEGRWVVCQKPKIDPFISTKLISFTLFSSIRIVLDCFLSAYFPTLRNSSPESAIWRNRDSKSFLCSHF